MSKDIGIVAFSIFFFSLFSLLFISPAVAWWNDSYPFRYEIDFTPSIVTCAPYYVNDTYGIKGKVVLAYLCGDGNFTYSKGSDMTNEIAIADRSSQVPWYFENGTGYLATGVWDDNYNFTTDMNNSAQINDTSENCMGYECSGMLHTFSSLPNTNIIGKFGNSIEFNGGGSYKIADGNGLLGDGKSFSAYTIEVWFAFNGTTKTIFLEKSDDMSYVSMRINATGGFECYHNNGSAYIARGSENLETTKKWYYGVCAWDGSTLRAYINGTEIGNVGVVNVRTDLTDGVFIGAEEDDSSPFAGYLDELRVSDIARSADYFRYQYYNGYGNLTTLSAGINTTIQLTNCTTLSNATALTFKIFDESNCSSHNGTLEISIDMYQSGTLVNNASFKLLNNDSYRLCIYPNTSSITADATMQFYDNGFRKRTYYLYQATVSNVSQDVNLYLISDSVGSRVEFTIKDAAGDVQENIYIKYLRYYADATTYKTVTISKTDAQGKTISYLEPYDAWYKFLLEKEGTLLQTITAKFISTSDLTDGVTFILQPTGQIEYLKWAERLSGTCTSTNNTQNSTVSCTVTDTSSLLTRARLYGYKIMAAENLLVCNKVGTGSAVTLGCVFNNTNDTVYFYQLFAELDLNPDNVTVLYSGYVGIEAAPHFGLEGVFVTFLLTGTCAFLALWNPPIAVMLFIASLSICAIFGLIAIDWTVLIGIIFVAAVIIYKMVKE